MLKGELLPKSVENQLLQREDQPGWSRGLDGWLPSLGSARRCEEAEGGAGVPLGRALGAGDSKQARQAGCLGVWPGAGDDRLTA